MKIELTDKRALHLYGFLANRLKELNKLREQMRGSSSIPSIKTEIRMLEDVLSAFEKADPEYVKLRALLLSTPETPVR